MESTPQITVAICTYNRSSYLRDTLYDLAVQKTDKKLYEILVIDNNSSDGTEAVCDRFRAANPGHFFKVVKEEKQGLSHARNRAVAESGTEILFFIDDDVRLPDEYVGKAIQFSNSRPQTLAAGGRIEVAFDGLESHPDWIPKPLMPMFGLHNLGEGSKIYPLNNFPRGGNMMIRKSLFQAFGGFDMTLGRMGDQLLGSEEKAFFQRIRKNGVELSYWGELWLTHRIPPHRLEKEYLRRQSVGIGYSEGIRAVNRLQRIGKYMSELLKLGVSLFLGICHLLRGRLKPALFLLRFRAWVLQGFYNSGKAEKNDRRQISNNRLSE
ncbi:MAG: glycosyltransferase family 2 protein [Balneolaceae bacterium]|nr:MAG: glycosyltransferase family 2 protein [Balneolaceae bacterium]